MNRRHVIVTIVLAVVIAVGGAALWIDFGVDVVNSQGRSEVHTPYGRDLRAFSGAGRLALERRGAELYDPANEVYAESGAASYVNPPWFAIVLIPIAAIPFGVLYPLWTLLGVLVSVWTIHRLGLPRRVVVLIGVMLSMSGVFAVYFGQNSFFLIAMLTIGVLAIDRGHHVTGGIAFALAAFKPHLLFGIVVWWLLELRRLLTVVLAAVATTIVLIAVSAIWLPGSWRAFSASLADPTRLVDPDVEVTGISMIRVLVGDGVLAIALSSVLVLVVIGALVHAIRRLAGDVRVSAALAIVASMIVALHGLPYDWLVLLVAGGLLLSHPAVASHDLAVAGLALAAALVLGDRLTEVQLASFGRAVHIAPLVLIGVYVWAVTRVTAKNDSHVSVERP